MAMVMDMVTETKTKVKNATIREHQLAMLEILNELDRICTENDISYGLFAGTLLGAVRHKGFIPWDDDVDVIMLRKDYKKFLEVADQYLDRKKFFLQAEFSEHWPVFFSKLRMNGTTCLERYHPNDEKRHQGIYIDIFPCDDAPNSELLRKCQFICSKVVIAKSLYARGYDTDSLIKVIIMNFCRLLPMKPCLNFCTRERLNSKYVHTFFASAKDYKKNVLPRKWITENVSVEFEGKNYPGTAYADSLLTLLYGDYMKPLPESQRKNKVHAILVDLDHSYEKYVHYRDGMKFDVLTRSIR